MNSSKKIPLVMILLVICTIIVAFYYNYDTRKLNFESEYFNGVCINEVVKRYQKYSPLLDEKLVKVLWFGHIAVKLSDSNTLKSIKLDNGKNITNNDIENINKKYKILSGENDIDKNYKKVFKDFNECILTFQVKNSAKEKLFEVSDDELRFFSNNFSLIRSIGESFTKFLTDECAEYIRRGNIYITRHQGLTVSSIELNLVRFIKFVLIK